jgi:nucleotide-binding universal stress UspA family protein
MQRILARLAGRSADLLSYEEVRQKLKATEVGERKLEEIPLIIMGGYGFSPVMEIVLGSAVDEVLRTSRRPVLICR